MKKLTGPLCAFLALVSAQGVRAEVDSKAIYRSLIGLKEIAENSQLDRKAMSYNETAIVKSIGQPDIRMKVISVMLELSDELSQEGAAKVSGELEPFEVLFGNSASELSTIVVDPDFSDETRIMAVKLLEQMALRFRFVDSLPAVSMGSSNAVVAQAVKDAQASVLKQRKLRFYNYNDAGRGPATLKE